MGSLLLPCGAEGAAGVPGTSWAGGGGRCIGTHRHHRDTGRSKAQGAGVKSGAPVVQDKHHPTPASSLNIGSAPVICLSSGFT